MLRYLLCGKLERFVMLDGAPTSSQSLRFQVPIERFANAGWHENQ